MNGRELLTHAGKISHRMALNKSGAEYEKFKEEQKKLSKESGLREIEEDIKTGKCKSFTTPEGSDVYRTDVYIMNSTPAGVEYFPFNLSAINM